MRRTLERVMGRNPVAAGVFTLLAWLGAPGCQAPQMPESNTAAEAGDADFEDLWTATLGALREAGLQPDRQDRVARIIVTLPETSGQWFEFWRGDVADPYSLFESSAQTVQRKVTVRFKRPARGGPWNVDVQADVYRLSRPERQVTTASSAFNIFSARLPLADQDPADFDAGIPSLVPLGRDGELEAKLLSRILGAAELPPVPPPPEEPVELQEGDGAAVPAE